MKLMIKSFSEHSKRFLIRSNFFSYWLCAHSISKRFEDLVNLGKINELRLTPSPHYGFPRTTLKKTMLKVPYFPKNAKSLKLMFKVES